MGGHQCVISLQNHNDSADYHIACFQVCSKNKWLIYPQHCINSIISLLVITEMFPCFRIIFQLQSLGSMILISADENILILALYLLLFLPLKPGCISTPCVITHPGSNNVVDPEPIHVWRLHFWINATCFEIDEWNTWQLHLLPKIRQVLHYLSYRFWQWWQHQARFSAFMIILCTGCVNQLHSTIWYFATLLCFKQRIPRNIYIYILSI